MVAPGLSGSVALPLRECVPFAYQPLAPIPFSVPEATRKRHSFLARNRSQHGQVMLELVVTALSGGKGINHTLGGVLIE